MLKNMLKQHKEKYNSQTNLRKPFHSEERMSRASRSKKKTQNKYSMIGMEANYKYDDSDLLAKTSKSRTAANNVYFIKQKKEPYETKTLQKFNFLNTEQNFQGRKAVNNWKNEYLQDKDEKMHRRIFNNSKSFKKYPKQQLTGRKIKLSELHKQYKKEKDKHRFLQQCCTQPHENKATVKYCNSFKKQNTQADKSSRTNINTNANENSNSNNNNQNKNNHQDRVDVNGEKQSRRTVRICDKDNRQYKFVQQLTYNQVFFCSKCYRYVFAVQKSYHYPQCRNQLKIDKVSEFANCRLDMLAQLSAYTKTKQTLIKHRIVHIRQHTYQPSQAQIVSMENVPKYMKLSQIELALQVIYMELVHPYENSNQGQSLCGMVLSDSVNQI